MAEPALKKRVLSKVRRPFLHKQPPEDEDTGQHANLVATPEQLNESSSRLLEPSIGLTECNRNMYAGLQYINPHYKVASMKVDIQLDRKTLILGLQTNDVEMLPWEYCAKRLESYGDLEMAIWAERLRSYHQNYHKLIGTYSMLINSGNPLISAAVALEAKQATQKCQDIEKNYAYSKITLYGNKSSMFPISLSYNEKMLQDVGHDLDSFMNCVKIHGVPAMFKGNTVMERELSKIFLSTTSMPLSFFQNGPDFEVFLYEHTGKKKPVKMKMYYAIDPGPEGFYVQVYIARIDVEPESSNPKESDTEIESLESNNPKQAKPVKYKHVKKKDSDSVDDSKETHEGHSEDLSDPESDC